MPFDIARIEELAPDQASLAAAAKLKKAELWSSLACDGAGLVWGECQGSGASPYRVVCSEADLGYKCTCPSRKFPCKHALALMWIRADGRLPFATGSAPAWVDDWLARRRPGAATARPGAEAKVKISIAQAAAGEPSVENPEAAARAAAQRERNRVEREASIRAGLDELDTWLADALRAGLASFLPAASERCRRIAQRLVDAKASGLASRIERLPDELLRIPEPLRTDALIEALATLHLMACAYRNQDRLPGPARADIRQMIGWPVTREALLADPDALRVRDCWMVVGTVAETQPDKLRRFETWLSRAGEGSPRFALLLDFLPVSLGKSANPYRVGDTFDAELAYFQSAAPLRAIVAQHHGAMPDRRFAAPAEHVAGAITRMHDVLAQRPWSDELPFAARSARIIDAGASLWLTDASGTTGLPLRAADDDQLAPLIGLEDIEVFGRFDGRLLWLSLCETSLGRWTDA